MATQRPKQDSSNGIVYIISYLFIWLSGIIVYVTEGQLDKRAKFHALQSIFLGIIIFILAFIPIVDIVAVALWVLGIIIGVIAYTGQDIVMPVIGPYAKRYSKQ